MKKLLILFFAFLISCKSKVNLPNLIGVWKSDPKDISLTRSHREVIIHFFDNGTLVYTIWKDDKQQKFFFTYEIDGMNMIIRESSSSNNDTARFILTGNYLEIVDRGFKGHYKKYIN